MSNDHFDKISSGVSKNTSDTNSIDNKNLQPITTNQPSLENPKSFSGNSPNLTQNPTDQNIQLSTFDVLATVTNNNSTSSIGNTNNSNSNNKQNLFKKFCQEPRLKDDLVDLGQAWLESVSGISIPYLRTDGRWHYLDKTKRFGYKASLSINLNGVPYLKLKYNDFRSGGSKSYFDSHQALSELYNHWKLFYGKNNDYYLSIYKKKKKLLLN